MSERSAQTGHSVGSTAEPAEAMHPRGYQADSYLGIQHIALQRFLCLTGDVAAVENARADKRYTSARSQIVNRYETLLQRVEESHAETRRKATSDHETLSRSIREQYDAQIAAIQAEYEKRCRRTNEESEITQREARKGMEQDLWLADSVADASREQLNRQREQLEKTAPGLSSRLDQVRERAEWLLEEMGYRTPVGAASADVGQSDSSDGIDDPEQDMQDLYEECLEQLEVIESLSTPRWVMGATPYMLSGLILGGFVGLGGLADLLISAPFISFVWTGPLGLIAGAVVAFLVIRSLRHKAQQQMHAAAAPLKAMLERAGSAVERYLQARREQLDKSQAEARERRDAEAGRTKDLFAQRTQELEVSRTASLAKLKDTLTRANAELSQQRDAHGQRLEAEHQSRMQRLDAEHRRFVDRLLARRERQSSHVQDRHDDVCRRMAEDWSEGVARLGRLLQEAAHINGQAPAWDTVYWQSYKPTNTFMPQIRFGEIRVDVSKLANCVVDRTGFDPAQTIGASATRVAQVPAALELPEHCSLLLQTGQQGRSEALAALRATMARVLTSLPAGRAHFTIIDPVGLGENFAGFMHLADYDEALVNGRIWTEKQHIEQRLGDLTGHMENVIQKYLRNEFETIDAYNVQAGELAEPYRFLVVADFPANFSEEAIRRLGSIVASGPRCGVYTLIAQDTRIPMPMGIHMDDVQLASVHIRNEDGRFVWQDDVLKRFPLTLDAPPDQETLTSLMHRIGQAAGRAKRVEVPFEFITPPADQVWSASSSEEIRVPIGRTGAVRLQELRLGRGVAQHTLIAGKTGSGKSTLLHVLITNLVLWYSPDEVEFYLIDFKKGVEFKTYATHLLPHARAIAIESDREFGLSVLQRLDAEMEHRGELFRAAGVQDLPGYRAATHLKLPRTLLVVDEFQIFFSEDDKLAQDAAILLDRLVRQGRAFGIHVLLGSQTLGGTSGLARSTIGQMAVRIALQCSEVDSQLIFDDGNSAARLLTRPGEAIYNDAGGLLQGNSPFQTAWLSDDQRDVYLDRVTRMVQDQPPRSEPQIVFEGNAPADLRRNRRLMNLLQPAESAAPADRSSTVSSPHFFLGEAVAIKDPTAAVFRRQSGSNLLLVGQRDDAALAIMSAGMIGLAAQHGPSHAEFVVFDGSASDSPHAFQSIAAALPGCVRFADYRSVNDVISELVNELHDRQSGGSGAESTSSRSVYILIYGLQRYRMLRRSEDFSFSYGSTDENAPPPVDKQFAELLREGPSVGMHVIAWADTPATLERFFDRQTMREFDNRVLFQMSAADSSNLIDSPMANRLGFYRALFFSEEQGLLEKFRPYSLPDRAMMDELQAGFAGRA